MVKSKTPKASSTTVEDLATLQSDVISFASSLGLVAGVPSSSSGFDDTDFRKPPKPVKPPVAKSPQENAKPTSKSHDPKVPKRNKPKPLEVAPFESNSDGAHKGAELPLMKSSSLSGPNFYFLIFFLILVSIERRKAVDWFSCTREVDSKLTYNVLGENKFNLI